MKILSLGAGVQSSTIFLMSCYGDIEKIDCAIFADTGWEPKAVYKWLEFLKREGEKYGIKIYETGAKNRETGKFRNIKQDALISQVRGNKQNGKRHVSMPYFVLSPDGDRGMIRRQCTGEYKIIPIQKKQRELLGYKPGQRIPEGSIEVWKGISTDESRRATMSTVKWIDFRYPLIEMRMSRGDCLNWFFSRGMEKPPRSSCIGCPFHSDVEWRKMKLESPKEFDEAVEFDKAIRKCGGMRGDVYLHAQRIPLGKIDFSSLEDNGQISFDDECAGVCGV